MNNNEFKKKICLMLENGYSINTKEEYYNKLVKKYGNNIKVCKTDKKEITLKLY